MIFRIRTTKKPQCIDFSSFRQERERERAHPKKAHTQQNWIDMSKKRKKYQKSTKSCIKRKRKVLKKNKTCFTVAEFWYFEHEISKSNGWICKLISNFSLSSFFSFFDFCWFFLNFLVYDFLVTRGTFDSFWLVPSQFFPFLFFLSFLGFSR